MSRNSARREPIYGPGEILKNQWLFAGKILTCTGIFERVYRRFGRDGSLYLPVENSDVLKKFNLHQNSGKDYLNQFLVLEWNSFDNSEKSNNEFGETCYFLTEDLKRIFKYFDFNDIKKTLVSLSKDMPYPFWKAFWDELKNDRTGDLLYVLFPIIYDKYNMSESARKRHAICIRKLLDEITRSDCVPNWLAAGNPHIEKLFSEWGMCIRIKNHNNEYKYTLFARRASDHIYLNPSLSLAENIPSSPDYGGGAGGL